MRDRVLVDYGAAAEPRERVRQETGRLFLHRQYLPSEMRVEMPQSAHHSHLRFLQALSGTSRAAPQLLGTQAVVCLFFPDLYVFNWNEWTCGRGAPSSPIRIQSELLLAKAAASRTYKEAPTIVCQFQW